MGLAEKRLFAEIEKEVEMVKNWLKSAFSKDIQVETDLDSFGGFAENEKLNGGTKFVKLVHREVVDVLVYGVGKDALGKDAVKESIDVMRFKNTPNETKVTLNGKVMEIAFPFTNADYKFDRSNVQALIEKNL